MPRTVAPVIPAGTFSSIQQPRLVVDDELLLRPFRNTDGAVVAAAFDDPDIRRWHGFRIDAPAEAEEWIERTHAQWTAERSVDWAIVGSDDTPLGRVALHVDLPRGHAEIAYWVLPNARRRGIALRSVGAATRWAHEWLGINRVLLQHSVHNLGSCAVAERAGFELEGTARAQDLHEDGWHDMHQHAHLDAQP